MNARPATRLRGARSRLREARYGGRSKVGGRRKVADDLVQVFQVEGPRLRGRLVRLGAALDQILSRHDYPVEVGAMLGEALALAATLASGLKFSGVFTVQAKGDGPVSMLIADYRTPGLLRGYAKVDRAALTEAAEAGPPSGPVPRLLGAGYLAFTVDQGENSERYQGIVELTGATLADCAHNYFRQSEQLGTGIRLAAGQVADGAGGRGWRAGGLMIQRLPGTERRAAIGDATDDIAEDAWRRALLLVGGVRDDELTDPDLAPNDLLYRLFHEDGVRVWRPHELNVGCTCSAQRVENVLRSFPANELVEMLVAGEVVASCQFCGNVYRFSAAELGLDSPDGLN